MATDDARKLFVAGLPDSVDEDALRQVFEATGGAVVQVSVPRDRATGRPRGFGFVTLSSAEEATRARETLDGSMHSGRSISVRVFSSDSRRAPGEGGDTRPRPEQRPYTGGPGAPGAPGAAAGGGGAPGGAGDDRSIYVGNLPYDADRPGLEALLKERGVNQVVRVHMPAGPDGRARGFAFVSLTSPEAVNEALNLLRNLEVGGRRLIINAAHARGERPERPAGGGFAPRPGGPPGGGFERPSMDRRPSGMGADFGAPAPQQRSSFDNRDFEGRREGKKKKPEAAKKKQVAAPDDRRRGGGNNWRTGLDSDDWSDD